MVSTPGRLTSVTTLSWNTVYSRTFYCSQNIADYISLSGLGWKWGVNGLLKIGNHECTLHQYSLQYSRNGRNVLMVGCPCDTLDGMAWVGWDGMGEKIGQVSTME